MRILKLHSTCLEEHFEQKKTVLKVFISIIISGLSVETSLSVCDRRKTFCMVVRTKFYMSTGKILGNSYLLKILGFDTFSGLPAKIMGLLAQSFQESC